MDDWNSATPSAAESAQDFEYHWRNFDGTDGDAPAAQPGSDIVFDEADDAGNAVDETADGSNGPATDSSEMRDAMTAPMPLVVVENGTSAETISGLTGQNPKIQRHVLRICKERSINMHNASPRELALVFSYVTDSCVKPVPGHEDLFTINPQDVFTEDPLFHGKSFIENALFIEGTTRRRFTIWLQHVATMIAYWYEHPRKLLNPAKLSCVRVKVCEDETRYLVSYKPTAPPHKKHFSELPAEKEEACALIRSFVSDLDQVRCLCAVYETATINHSVALAFVPTPDGDVDVCFFDPMPTFDKKNPVAAFLKDVQKDLRADPTYWGRRIRDIVYFSGWQAIGDATANTCAINSLFWICNVYLNAHLDPFQETDFMSIGTVQKVTDELNRTMLNNAKQRAFMYQYMVSLMTYVFLR